MPSSATAALALVPVLALAACAGAPVAPVALQGPLQWSFDEAPKGRPPAEFVVDATRRVGPLATWEVAAPADAPSPPHVLSLSYPNHKSYDSFNLCWLPGVQFADGVVSVRMCARSGKEDQGGGLIWRAASTQDYYVVRLNPLEGNLRLYHVLLGNRSMLASADCTAKPGQWYELRVEHVGDRIQCSVDGEVRIEVRDVAIPGAGGIGLWTKADAATDFDDLRAEPAAAK